MRPPVELIEAATFTAGCAAIHQLRADPDLLTEILIALLVALTLIFALVDGLTYEPAGSTSYDLLGALASSP